MKNKLIGILFELEELPNHTRVTLVDWDKLGSRSMNVKALGNRRRKESSLRSTMGVLEANPQAPRAGRSSRSLG